MNKDSKNKHPFIKFLVIGAVIIIIVLLYSRFIATKGLAVKEYKITNEIITDNFHGFKIVHLSDIHYGRTVNKTQLENLVNEVNLLKPDIVVLTGDLIDKDTEMSDILSQEISDLLNKINANVGKYAIKGNHDKYFIEWEYIISASGFKNINDTYELVYSKGYNPILLAGISSNTSDQITIEEKYRSIEEFINSDESFKNIYKILLIHEPDFIDNINYSYFNLALAGHSHNGQVRLPIIGATILPEYAKKYYNEHYKLNNTDLYISSGVGTSTISFRLFNKPSINFYRLTNK